MPVTGCMSQHGFEGLHWHGSIWPCCGQRGGSVILICILELVILVLGKRGVALIRECHSPSTNPWRPLDGDPHSAPSMQSRRCRP